MFLVLPVETVVAVEATDEELEVVGMAGIHNPAVPEEASQPIYLVEVVHG